MIKTKYEFWQQAFGSHPVRTIIGPGTLASILSQANLTKPSSEQSRYLEALKRFYYTRPIMLRKLALRYS